MAIFELDARGLLCPMPVIRAQDRIAQLQDGDILAVHCSDPGAANDIPAWCRINGHTILDINQDNEILVIRIQVNNGEI
jgi:tRNA 2-thiouridine synthesizing protein A